MLDENQILFAKGGKQYMEQVIKTDLRVIYHFHSGTNY
jgi:hypothetical protein